MHSIKVRLVPVPSISVILSSFLTEKNEKKAEDEGIKKEQKHIILIPLRRFIG